MIRTTLGDIKRYFVFTEALNASVDFIMNNDLISLKPGKYTIDGTRIFALIQEVVTMPESLAPFENHMRYADLQMTISGEECVGYTPVVTLEKIGDYDLVNDVQLYTGKATVLMQNKALHSISLFFPEDGHQPYVAPKAPALIKKIVIRIDTDLLNGENPMVTK